MQRVAQDWLVLQLTHGSGTALGITTGLQFLPQLLFSLWGGVIADRYPKRRILFATQAAMGALALILGVLALTGAVAIWQVYLLAFLLGMVAVVDNPTRQTFVAEMVGRTGMANAIALNSAVFNLARITGPAVAGLVISAVGTPAAFLVNAASFGAVLVGLKLMRPSELHPVERAPRAPGQLREALAYVRARPSLWLTLALVFFVATFGMNFQVTNALMSRGVFHTGAGAFGLASTVFAVGALGGALLAARRARPGMRLLLGTALAFGLLEVVSGLMPDVLVVPGPAGAHRPRAADVHHHRQLGHPARRQPGGPRPRDGPVHAGVPRRRPAGVAAGRLGGRAVRAAGEPDRGRRCLGPGGCRGCAAAGPGPRDARPQLPPPGTGRSRACGR